MDRQRITVFGQSVSGALGLYAAILDARISQVILKDPPATYADGPTFLNVMRHADLPEAAALVAPRPVIFYGRMPGAYKYTRHVYRLLGKPERIGVAMHIEGVIEGRYEHGFSSWL